MDIDYYARSQDLLNTLANAIHDRPPGQQVHPQPFFFHGTECTKTADWLRAFVKDLIEKNK